MATRVPLPRMCDLPEVVLFHREDLRDPTIILQIPNADRTDAETYVLRLDREGDVGWMEGLPGYRWLRPMLGVEQHVVLYVREGHARPLADLDADSPFAEALKDARANGAYGGGDKFIDRMFQRRQQHQARATHATMTPFRAALLGRRDGERGGLLR